MNIPDLLPVPGSHPISNPGFWFSLGWHTAWVNRRLPGKYRSREDTPRVTQEL